MVKRYEPGVYKHQRAKCRKYLPKKIVGLDKVKAKLTANANSNSLFDRNHPISTSLSNGFSASMEEKNAVKRKLFEDNINKTNLQKKLKETEGKLRVLRSKRSNRVEEKSKYEAFDQTRQFPPCVTFAPALKGETRFQESDESPLSRPSFERALVHENVGNHPSAWYQPRKTAYLESITFSPFPSRVSPSLDSENASDSWDLTSSMWQAAPTTAEGTSTSSRTFSSFSLLGE